MFSGGALREKDGMLDLSSVPPVLCHDDNGLTRHEDNVFPISTQVPGIHTLHQVLVIGETVEPLHVFPAVGDARSDIAGCCAAILPR